MPRSTAHNTRTQACIVDAAVRAFREHGVEPIFNADVMRAAGFTHGGFYAHFPSKDALVAEAATRGLTDSRRVFLLAAAEANPHSPLREIIRRYVSRSHRDHPAEGCAMPALAADVARQPDEVRRAFSSAGEEFVTHLAAY